MCLLIRKVIIYRNVEQDAKRSMGNVIIKRENFCLIAVN